MTRFGYALMMTVCCMLFTMVFATQAQNEVSVAQIITEENEAEQPEFTILIQLLETIDLIERLADTNLLWLVFAPTDEAFETYFETIGTDLETFLQNPERVAALLGYHLTDEPLLPANFTDGLEIITFINQPIIVSVDIDAKLITLNDDASLPITSQPIVVANGIIYPIDAVLIRPRNVVDSAEPVFSTTATPEPSPTTVVVSTATATPESPEPDEDEDEQTITATPMPVSTEGDTVLPNNGEGDCILFIAFEEQADVRVGPGNNRTGITFLDFDIEYDVLAYSVDERGVIWYELDREAAAPGRLIEQAWVSSEEVLTDGDCTDLELGDATPLIPIEGSDD